MTRTEVKRQRYAVTRVQSELACWYTIKEAIEQAAASEDGEIDTQLVMDTIEGETDLLEALTAVYMHMREAEAALIGTQAFEDQIASRKTRIKKHIQTLRDALTMALDGAGIPSIATPAGTFGVKKRSPGLQITDESAVPSKYWKPQPPKLDRTALTTALKGGAEVPGAGLDNGGISFFSRKT